jgi:hypothetical protein
MAMLNIEYRHSGDVEKGPNVRRNVLMMKSYLQNLVKEMREAGISAEYIDSVASGEKNSVLINGKTVQDIIKGLKLMMLEDDDHCDYGSSGKLISIGRPVLEWDQNVVEDVPDVTMKNAISKMYADIRADKI